MRGLVGAMRKKLLVIGAGASYGARENDRCIKVRPPLGLDLLNFLRICLDDLQQGRIPGAIHNGAQSVFEESEIKEIEQLLNLSGILGIESFEKWANIILAGSRYFHNMWLINRFLAYALAYPCADKLPNHAFSEKQDLYDELIKKAILPNPRDWSVISLNYDCLFEQALSRLNIPWRYHGVKLGSRNRDERNRDGIPVYKIHGSINWFPAESEVSKLNLDPRTKQVNLELGPVFSCELAEVLTELSPSVGAAPIIAFYSELKPAMQCARAIQQIRRDANKVTARCGAALVIGVRPLTRKTDDSVVFEIFKKLGTLDADGSILTKYISVSAEDLEIASKKYRLRTSSLKRASFYDFLLNYASEFDLK